MFETKVVDIYIYLYIFCVQYPPPPAPRKSRLLWDNGEIWHITIQYGTEVKLFACQIRDARVQTHTKSYCWSTATMVHERACTLRYIRTLLVLFFLSVLLMYVLFVITTTELHRVRCYFEGDVIWKGSAWSSLSLVIGKGLLEHPI
jgi:hypothetical protein